MFVIEDEWHCEHLGEFQTRARAIEELERLAAIRWDKPPNQCPCISWKTCSRRYTIVEYDVSTTPWSMIGQTSYLDVSAKGVNWLTSNPP